MIRIIAQSEPYFTPEEKKRLKVKQLPDETIPDIPMADDENVPPGEQEIELQPDQQPQFPPEEITPVPSNQPAPEPKQETPVLPENEKEEETTFPEDEYEEITEDLNELDRLNMSLSIWAKVDMSLAEGYPLRIIYTTLKGHTTERTVRPDYYLPARTTGNWVLIAWCELRNGLRRFIVDRIKAAKLEQKTNE
jgi:hypothetical protein